MKEKKWNQLRPTELLVYFVVFACIVASSIRAFIGAITSDIDLMIRGIIGTVMEVSILGVFLWFNGKLFNNQNK